MIFGHFKHTLQFKIPSGTSRGVLKAKDSWIVFAHDEQRIRGLGECSIIKGLSPDPEERIEPLISYELQNIDIPSWAKGVFKDDFKGFPAVRFAFESMARGIQHGNPFDIVDPDSFEGQKTIPINGLVWMGDRASMLHQVRQKIEAGYNCIKIKIGAIDFEEECSLLQYIRLNYGSNDIEIRVDANGAFAPDIALEKLKRLSKFDIHSIEQPILSRQWQDMARLCEFTPVPIALDEELIGIEEDEVRIEMLECIGPQYIILKPSLLGGLAPSSRWIALAQERKIGWWVTSALESNIGLNAIAQWTAMLYTRLPQGLGTGQLFINNFESPMTIEKGHLYWASDKLWEIPDVMNKRM